MGRRSLRLSGVCRELERRLHEGLHAQLPQVRHRRLHAHVDGGAQGHRYLSVRRLVHGSHSLKAGLVHGSHSLKARMVVHPSREWFEDLSAE